jgi:hypothetical protein
MMDRDYPGPCSQLLPETDSNFFSTIDLFIDYSFSSACNIGWFGAGDCEPTRPFRSCTASGAGTFSATLTRIPFNLATIGSIPNGNFMLSRLPGPFCSYRPLQLYGPGASVFAVSAREGTELGPPWVNPMGATFLSSCTGGPVPPLTAGPSSTFFVQTVLQVIGGSNLYQIGWEGSGAAVENQTSASIVTNGTAFGGVTSIPESSILGVHSFSGLTPTWSTTIGTIADTTGAISGSVTFS